LQWKKKVLPLFIFYLGVVWTVAFWLLGLFWVAGWLRTILRAAQRKFVCRMLAVDLNLNINRSQILSEQEKFE